MSASESLHHKQFIQLYRGLREATPETLDIGNMGPHWTTDYDVARNYAGADYEDSEGTIVSAKVHKRNIMQEGSEELEHARSRWGVMDSDDPWGRYEQEQTVRPGAPIHITEIKHLLKDGGSRTTNRGDMTISELRKYRA